MPCDEKYVKYLEREIDRLSNEIDHLNSDVSYFKLLSSDFTGDVVIYGTMPDGTQAPVLSNRDYKKMYETLDMQNKKLSKKLEDSDKAYGKLLRNSLIICFVVVAIVCYLSSKSIDANYKRGYETGYLVGYDVGFEDAYNGYEYYENYDDSNAFDYY